MKRIFFYHYYYHMFLIFVPPTCFDCNNDEYIKVLIMNEYVTKSKKLYPKTPLSIFMVRLILCDCSLCQHGFDIQINQNILEKLISLEAKLLYKSFAMEQQLRLWLVFSNIHSMISKKALHCIVNSLVLKHM